MLTDVELAALSNAELSFRLSAVEYVAYCLDACCAADVELFYQLSEELSRRANVVEGTVAT